MIDENPGKSMRDIVSKISKRLKEQRGQFMWAKTTQENCLMRVKRLFKKLKHLEEENCLRFFSDEQNFHQDQKVDPRMMVFVVVSSEGHIMTPIFPQGLGVNADEDAYVATLQTIIVKPPWIDSVANGGRPPYVLQQDSPPFHKALKSQDWTDGREFSSCYTKLMPAS
ncbi:hypothetical protein ACTXT7_015296 [Hymenolepis weldensis]